jgi:hypothetical protein
MAMRNRWADEFEREHRTSACVHGRHADCPHLHGFGGGLNPWRLHPKLGAELCTCDCHSSCPVTSTQATIPPQGWRESCTCPGAGTLRAWLDQQGMEFPNFITYRAQAQRDSQARKEAMDAVRARAAGMSPDQVQGFFKAELRARELEIPSDDILDTYVSAIMGDSLPGIRLTGRALAELAKLLGRPGRPI